MEEGKVPDLRCKSFPRFDSPEGERFIAADKDNTLPGEALVVLGTRSKRIKIHEREG